MLHLNVSSIYPILNYFGGFLLHVKAHFLFIPFIHNFIIIHLILFFLSMKNHIYHLL